MPVDVVCGMLIPESDAHYFKSTHKGREYSFCSEECKEEFDDDPSFYADTNGDFCGDDSE